MSEIGLNINVDSYNNEGIKTIKGNNNAEIYKLYILKNKRRLSLVGKTVKLGYVMVGTTNGDVIENLNITNAEQGEITFPITNRISKKDGVYSCQLAIYGADGFLEHTATFGLTVEANIFTKIAGEIADSKDLTYIERILEESKTVSGDLKTNIPVATNLNSSLESNISNARNINTTLADTTEKSKVAATDAIEKKSQLESSITKAKEFIDGLDGSQNIPQLRLDVTELQNGLKSNQALAYTGSSISANNTLEGRTEGIKIKGRTLKNIFTTSVNNLALSDVSLDGNTFIVNPVNNRYPSIYDKNGEYKENTNYTVILDILENTLQSTSTSMTLNFGNASTESVLGSTLYRFDVSNGKKGRFIQNVKTIPDFSILTRNLGFKMYMNNNYTGGKLKFNIMVIETSMLGTKQIPSYFGGIKSFGESEQEGDKYKISILSTGKNILNINEWVNGSWNGSTGAFEQPPTTVKQRISSKTKQKLLSHKTIVFTAKEPFNIAIRYFDENDNFIQDVTGFLPNKTFTPPKEAQYYTLTLAKNDITQNVDINWLESLNLQMEEGVIGTSYQPYKEDKKDILLKKPLREWDTLYEDNGQVKVDRLSGQYTFTGNENFAQLNNDNNSLSVYVDMNTLNLLLNGITVCNNFNYLAPNDLVSKYLDGISISGSSKNRFLFRISTSKLSTPDIDGFKAWLKANPTTVIYQLATPVTEIVENCVDIDLDTYQEKTYFNILNSIKGSLDFKVPSNIASIVQSNSKAINELYNLIDTLVLPNILQNTTDIEMLKLEKLK